MKTFFSENVEFLVKNGPWAKTGKTGFPVRFSDENPQDLAPAETPRIGPKTRFFPKSTFFRAPRQRDRRNCGTY